MGRGARPVPGRRRHRTARQRTLVRALRKHGFYLARSGGRHLIYKHPAHGAHVAVPRHAKDLANGTLEAILRAAERIVGGVIEI